MKSKHFEFISPGSIGSKIKKLREYRDLTQKQLGMLCGFSEMTAQVRIGQYENNSRIPNETILTALAEALSVDKDSFLDTDLSPKDKAMHALFDIEDLHGLRPIQVNGHIYLDFCGTTSFGKKTEYHEYSWFLNKWYNIREKTMPTPNDTQDELLRKRKEYDLWRYEYPINEAEEFSKQLHLRMKKKRLEDELKKINEELNSSKD